MLSAVKIICIIVSVWWIVAFVSDLLYVFFYHNPTDLTTYFCNPFCILFFPMLELSMPKGILVWLLGFCVVMFTSMYFF